VAAVFKRLRFAGASIVTLSEGEITELHVGLKGTMNALFLKDLALKTHRGIRGRVEAGKIGGGNAYGYRVVKTLDASGEPVRGEREIDQEQAEIVRRIFREYVAGKGPQKIAADLTARASRARAASAGRIPRSGATAPSAPASSTASFTSASSAGTDNAR
jgi:DNA invertase Pin-like site-specific DNA recombinase